MLTSSTPFLFLKQGGFQDILKYKLASCVLVKHALSTTCQRFRLQFYDNQTAHILYFLRHNGRKCLTNYDDLDILKLMYILFPFTHVPNLKQQMETTFVKYKRVTICVKDVPDIRPTNPYIARASMKKDHIQCYLELDWSDAFALAWDFDRLNSEEVLKCTYLERKHPKRTFRICPCCCDANLFENNWYFDLARRVLVTEIKWKR